MLITGIVVTVVAWWRAGIGGFLMLLFGLVYSTFAYFSAEFQIMLAPFASIMLECMY